jgi:formylglycine-generating enzyme required for sulfatase activity
MGQDAVTSAGISTAVPGSATIGRFYLSETELTRDQWIALVVAAGVSVSREPWVAADAAAGLTTLAGGSRPATGLSYEMVTDVVAAWNAKSVFRLRLPTGSEWEAACRAGSTTPWSWGDSQSMSTVGTYAVVSGTALAAGPSAVATARANAFGFYVMHGNAWEWVSAGGAAREASLSGGSWSDHPISSRSGNVLPLSTQVAYPLAGVRLALEVQ